MATHRDWFSGVVGGLGCTACGLPFDVAKARLQTQATSEYTGLVDCLLKVFGREGPVGLYRGFMPALTSAVAENMVGVPVQRGLRRGWNAFRGNTPDHRLSFVTETCLGGATGLFTATTITPFEVLKVQQQTRASQDGLLTVLRSVLARDGAAGMFRGLASVIVRDIPYNAFFYGSYETFCTACMRIAAVSRREDLPLHHIFFSGGLAGICGWTLILPLDVRRGHAQDLGFAPAGPSRVSRSPLVRAGGEDAVASGGHARVGADGSSRHCGARGLESALHRLDRSRRPRLSRQRWPFRRRRDVHQGDEPRARPARHTSGRLGLFVGVEMSIKGMNQVLGPPVTHPVA